MQALTWLYLAIEGGYDEARSLRDELERTLSPADVVEAKRVVEDCYAVKGTSPVSDLI